MVQTASLFSQILSLFGRSEFARHVKDLKAEHRAKGFTCWEQFVSMLFCQLAQARSLREITQGLLSCEGKLKHLGLDRAPKAVHALLCQRPSTLGALPEALL